MTGPHPLPNIVLMSNTHDTLLSSELGERVLTRLGFSRTPEPTPDGLRALYAAWCRQVPFDNVRKLIHVRSGNSGPLPGSTPPDFFESWLAHGTGGTCWSGAGAFHALLSSLGFDASRGIATMLVAPHLPPNHGTVLVTLEGRRFLADGSILHGEPLELAEESETRVDHPAWGVRCARREGFWHIAWRPLHKVDGFECRLDRWAASHADYETFYHHTRGWSPFNFEVTARRNRGESVVGVAFGHAVTLNSDGSVHRRPATSGERRRILVEDVGISEELVSQLPEDIPTPPPPGSHTAQSGTAR